MKKLNCLLSIIALTAMLACEPPVTFTGPQPPDTGDLAAFPKRLKGEYLGTDSSRLIIRENLVQRIYDYDTKVHVKDLGSNSRLSGDTITDLETKEKSVVSRVGDSLIRH